MAPWFAAPTVEHSNRECIRLRANQATHDEFFAVDAMLRRIGGIGRQMRKVAKKAIVHLESDPFAGQTRVAHSSSCRSTLSLLPRPTPPILVTNNDDSLLELAQDGVPWCHASDVEREFLLTIGDIVEQRSSHNVYSGHNNASPSKPSSMSQVSPERAAIRHRSGYIRSCSTNARPWSPSLDVSNSSQQDVSRQFCSRLHPKGTIVRKGSPVAEQECNSDLESIQVRCSETAKLSAESANLRKDLRACPLSSSDGVIAVARDLFDAGCLGEIPRTSAQSSSHERNLDQVVEAQRQETAELRDALLREEGAVRELRLLHEAERIQKEDGLTSPTPSAIATQHQRGKKRHVRKRRRKGLCKSRPGQTISADEPADCKEKCLATARTEMFSADAPAVRRSLDENMTFDENAVRDSSKAIRDSIAPSRSEDIPAQNHSCDDACGLVESTSCAVNTDLDTTIHSLRDRKDRLRRRSLLAAPSLSSCGKSREHVFDRSTVTEASSALQNGDDSGRQLVLTPPQLLMTPSTSATATAVSPRVLWDVQDSEESNACSVDKHVRARPESPLYSEKTSAMNLRKPGSPPVSRGMECHWPLDISQKIPHSLTNATESEGKRVGDGFKAVEAKCGFPLHELNLRLPRLDHPQYEESQNLRAPRLDRSQLDEPPNSPNLRAPRLDRSQFDEPPNLRAPRWDQSHLEVPPEPEKEEEPQKPIDIRNPAKAQSIPPKVKENSHVETVYQPAVADSKRRASCPVLSKSTLPAPVDTAPAISPPVRASPPASPSNLEAMQASLPTLESMRAEGETTIPAESTPSAGYTCGLQDTLVILDELHPCPIALTPDLELDLRRLSLPNDAMMHPRTATAFLRQSLPSRAIKPKRRHTTGGTAASVVRAKSLQQTDFHLQQPCELLAEPMHIGGVGVNNRSSGDASCQIGVEDGHLENEIVSGSSRSSVALQSPLVDSMPLTCSSLEIDLEVPQLPSDDDTPYPLTSANAEAVSEAGRHSLVFSEHDRFLAGGEASLCDGAPQNAPSPMSRDVLQVDTEAYTSQSFFARQLLFPQQNRFRLDQSCSTQMVPSLDACEDEHQERIKALIQEQEAETQVAHEESKEEELMKRRVKDDISFDRINDSGHQQEKIDSRNKMDKLTINGKQSKLNTHHLYGDLKGESEQLSRESVQEHAASSSWEPLGDGSKVDGLHVQETSERKMKQFWGCRQQDKKEQEQGLKGVTLKSKAKPRKRAQEKMHQDGDEGVARHSTEEERKMSTSYDESSMFRSRSGDHHVQGEVSGRGKCDEVIARHSTEEERKMSTSYEESTSNPRKSHGMEDKRPGAKAEDKRSGVKDEASKQGAVCGDGDRDRDWSRDCGGEGGKAEIDARGCADRLDREQERRPRIKKEEKKGHGELSKRAAEDKFEKLNEDQADRKQQRHDEVEQDRAQRLEEKKLIGHQAEKLLPEIKEDKKRSDGEQRWPLEEEERMRKEEEDRRQVEKEAQRPKYEDERCLKEEEMKRREEESQRRKDDEERCRKAEELLTAPALLESSRSSLSEAFLSPSPTKLARDAPAFRLPPPPYENAKSLGLPAKSGSLSASSEGASPFPFCEHAIGNGHQGQEPRVWKVSELEAPQGTVKYVEAASREPTCPASPESESPADAVKYLVAASGEHTRPTNSVTFQKSDVLPIYEIIRSANGALNEELVAHDFDSFPTPNLKHRPNVAGTCHVQNAHENDPYYNSTGDHNESRPMIGLKSSRRSLLNLSVGPTGMKPESLSEPPPAPEEHSDALPLDRPADSHRLTDMVEPPLAPSEGAEPPYTGILGNSDSVRPSDTCVNLINFHNPGHVGLLLEEQLPAPLAGRDFNDSTHSKSALNASVDGQLAARTSGSSLSEQKLKNSYGALPIIRHNSAHFSDADAESSTQSEVWSGSPGSLIADNYRDVLASSSYALHRALATSVCLGRRHGLERPPIARAEAAGSSWHGSSSNVLADVHAWADKHCEVLQSCIRKEQEL